MFSTKNAQFDRLIEKATSKLLLDPDWETTILICDSIRQGDIQPSYAISSIKKKVEDENPHVAKYALIVLESIVKNCGSIIHVEIATREFMDFLKERATKGAEPVKAKIVELVQIWSHAFRNDSCYRVVQDTFNQMKNEGFLFPTLKESDAMFVAEKAPEWRDGELCYRCRISFGPITRKHHCRACGQVFCQKCTSKNSIIPKFGIEKGVRVCDGCFDQINNKEKEEALPAEYLASSLSKQSQIPPSKTEAEIQEEEELQLAIALSQSEAEHKEHIKSKNKCNNYTPANDSMPIYSTPNKVTTSAVLDTSDMDPELARYLNRNYWQQKSQEIATQAVNNTPTTQPSAPTQIIEMNNVSHLSQVKQDVNKNEVNEEREEYIGALRSSIDIFMNRMKSNHQRGRNIANDSSVQTLFVTLNAMHPTLIKYIQQQEDTRGEYERMQDKLAQVKDARDALDVLRQEHLETKRRQQEEQDRIRQLQMANKLEILRQQKQVYLEYQRQLAAQRMGEQEEEMRRRLEMLKHEQHVRSIQYGVYPQQGYGMQIGVTYSPEASPHHQLNPLQQGMPQSSQQHVMQQVMPQQQGVPQGTQPHGMPQQNIHQQGMHQQGMSQLPNQPHQHPGMHSNQPNHSNSENISQPISQNQMSYFPPSQFQQPSGQFMGHYTPQLQMNQQPLPPPQFQASFQQQQIYHQPQNQQERFYNVKVGINQQQQQPPNGMDRPVQSGMDGYTQYSANLPQPHQQLPSPQQEASLINFD